LFPGALGLVEAPAVSNEGRRRPGLFFVVEPNRTQLSGLGQRIAARRTPGRRCCHAPLARGGQSAVRTNQSKIGLGCGEFDPVRILADSAADFLPTTLPTLPA
jgi:hypothetical protein